MKTISIDALYLEKMNDAVKQATHLESVMIVKKHATKKNSYLATTSTNKKVIVVETLTPSELRNQLYHFIRENITSYSTPKEYYEEIKNYSEKKPCLFKDTSSECPICFRSDLDTIQMLSLPHCGHKYCGDCIPQVVNMEKCAVCRQSTLGDYNLCTIEKMYKEEKKDELFFLLVKSGMIKQHIENLLKENEPESLLGYDFSTVFEYEGETIMVFVIIP